SGTWLPPCGRTLQIYLQSVHYLTADGTASRATQEYNRNSSRPPPGNRNLDGARGRNLAAQLKKSRFDGPEQRLNSVAYVGRRVVVRSKIIADSWRRAGSIYGFDFDDFHLCCLQRLL